MSPYFSKNGTVARLLCLMALLFLSAPDQGRAITTATSANTPAHNSKTWQQMSAVEKTQAVCAITAGIAFIVAEIWFIVAGFKTSVGWGLFMLFIGGMRSIAAAIIMIGWLLAMHRITENMPDFTVVKAILVGYVIFAGTGAIIFFVRHWDEARKPLKVMAFGILLVLVVVGLGSIK